MVDIGIVIHLLFRELKQMLYNMEPDDQIIDDASEQMNQTTDGRPPNALPVGANEPTIITLPISLSQLMQGFDIDRSNHMNIGHGMDMNSTHHSLEEQITHQSFNEPTPYKQICSHEFVDSLSVQTTTPDMVEQGITCGICLEDLRVDERVVELPCKDKHYFHIKKDECGGIYPWLQENHTCPMCRYEFPSEEKELIESDTPGPEHEHGVPSPTITEPRILPDPDTLTQQLFTMVTNALQEEEDRMLQEVLYLSLQAP
jgi:hypothetical protein